MNFEVYGPFELIEIDEDGFYSGWIDQPEINEFWVQVKKQHENLDNACGVYMFCVEGKQKGERGQETTSLPWYVGKAEKLTFKQECFNHRNQLSYNKVISHLYREVKAINFYFIARHDKNGELSAPAKKDDGTVYEGVRFVERLFMQKSLAANNHLLNVKDLKDARGTHIRNILNWAVQGKDDSSVTALKDSLGINGHVSLLKSDSDSKELGFYPVYGPYEFPTYKSGTKTVDDEFVSAFWSQFASDSENMPDFPKAAGVYVIGVRHGNNITPHYIGTSKGYSYQLACFQERSRIEHIVRKSGTPVVFFLPRVSDKSHKKVEGIKKTKWILDNMEFVEKWLLGYGIVKNPKITTGEGVIAAVMRDLCVEGFVNPQKRGARSKPVRELRKLLGE
ncbi:MAG: hypothetical protein OXE51_06460 [Gammaproteobacteria bacterium]|nr:hypothetical protein [Gammaproteobacteria bacterium]